MQDQSRGNHIFFFCKYFWQGLGVEHFENVHIVCIYSNSLIALARKRGVAVFCLQEADALSSVHTTEELLQHPLVQRYVSGIDSGANILLYKTSLKIEKICQRAGWNLLANQSSFIKQFEDKVNFYSRYQELLPFPPSYVGVVHDSSYEDVSHRIGNAFVVQTRRGFAGNSTFFVHNEAEYQALLPLIGGRLARMSSFIPGKTFTVNASVFFHKVFVGEPMYQITGDTRLNKFAGGTCGIDLSWRMPNTDDMVWETLKQKTREVGLELMEKGYQGIFGTDWVVDESGRAYLIECNPRLVASMPFFSKKQISRAEQTFLEQHILAFYPLFSRRIIGLYLSRAISGGAQIILRNVYNHGMRLGTAPRSGIYRFEHGLWMFVKEEYDINRVQTDDVLVLLREDGKEIPPNGEIGLIQTHQSFLDEQGNLNKDFSVLYDALYPRKF